MRRPATPAGELDREIKLQFKTAGTSGSGEPTETWTDGQGGAADSSVTVWAAVRPLSGSEYWAARASQVVAEEMHVFTIRHRTDVRAGTARVKYNPGDLERIYNVRRVAEVGRRERLDVYADTKVA